MAKKAAQYSTSNTTKGTASSINGTVLTERTRSWQYEPSDDSWPNHCLLIVT